MEGPGKNLLTGVSSENRRATRVTYLASFGVPYSNRIVESSIGMRPSSVP